MDNLIIKWIFVIVGGILGSIAPTIPFALICLFASCLDCVTAWRLARRIKRKYPDSKPHVKFESEKFFSIFTKFLILFGCIILAYLIDVSIFPMIDLYLANMVAGSFCIYELWSILENESSESSKPWAKVLQKIMINKASRYLEDIGDTIKEVNKKE